MTTRKFEYAPGESVRVTKLEPEEFERQMMNVEKSIQRIQKIPNRLFGARMKVLSGEAV